LDQEPDGIVSGVLPGEPADEPVDVLGVPVILVTVEDEVLQLMRLVGRKLYYPVETSPQEDEGEIAVELQRRNTTSIAYTKNPRMTTMELAKKSIIPVAR